MADWVLSTFSDEEKKEVYARIEDAARAVELIVKGQMSEAMNRYTKTVKPVRPESDDLDDAN
jgi:PTH1 family peptidyl-tRNA hydrolase